MFKSVQVKEDIYWVGALDPDLRIFDIIMYTQHGTSYNSFIVKGSTKTALFETVKHKYFDQCLERIQDVCDPKDIDYIIVDHTEPDHVGSVVYFLDICPHATVVGTGAAIRFLREITNIPFESMVVTDGDTLDLGNKTVKFIMTPFLHWPDTMYSYIVEDKTLITCDSFGCHYSDERVVNDKIPGDFLDAYKYYFDMIMGPFKSYVLQALDKIKDLPIDCICTGHGPVLRTDIPKYLDLYRNWATVQERSKPSVVICYVSAYGYTKKLAEQIASGAEASGDLDVLLFDLVEANKEEALAELASAKGILFGSPTIVSDALPPIWEILIALNPVIHKGKLAGAFGSYGWSGEAVSNIEGRLQQLRFKIPVPGLKISFNPSEAQLQQAYEFGSKFGAAVLGKDA